MEDVKLDAFRKKVRARNSIGRVMLLIGAALAVMDFVMREHIAGGFKAADFFKGFGSAFNIGVIYGIMSVAILFIIRNNKALKDDEKLKKLYIAETDERNLSIYQKAGSTGMNTITVGLLIGACVSIYFNMTVFFTLLGACLFVSLVRGVFKLYYHKRY